MKIQVLDHGYVEFVEAWGTGKSGVKGLYDDDPDYERGIIEAARQSTQGSFRGWEEDTKLLTYLYENQHLTPFEQAGMTIEVQAPIFVFREWHRHRTQSYNEMSARYAPLPDLYYVPDLEQSQYRANLASANKQSQAAEGFAGYAVSAHLVGNWIDDVKDLYRKAESLYQGALSKGIPKELARLAMPVGHYSRMRASANLRNWLQFLTLRMAPNAQWEIRQYAYAVGNCIAQYFPQTWELFAKERE